MGEALGELVGRLRRLTEELRDYRAGLTENLALISADDLGLLRGIDSALPLLDEAYSHFPYGRAEENVITYKIVTDLDGRLKTGAKTACNFWNRFVVPRNSIVIRLGTFTAESSTIARAYRPYAKDGIVYGNVEFNTKYLSTFTANDIAGTIVHEIGHTLGFGWDDWLTLFDAGTGKFNAAAIQQLAGLGLMSVELDGGPGTELSHWDEQGYDKELMTGYKDPGEHVLPVTIDVLELLGHRVQERLSAKTGLNDLLTAVSLVEFTRENAVRTIDKDHYEKTDLFEVLPHDSPAEA